MPEQPPPDQPANVDPLSWAAVRVTWVPSSNWAEQLEPQLMPAGVLVTDPPPDPEFVTVSVCWEVPVPKVAVTDSSAFIVTVQVPVPEHPPPDQPVNVEPDPGVAVNVTCVPTSNGAEQVLPQSIPAAELITVPDPPPAVAAVSLWVVEATLLEYTSIQPPLSTYRWPAESVAIPLGPQICPAPVPDLPP